jgi:hypothetical protein
MGIFEEKEEKEEKERVGFVGFSYSFLVGRLVEKGMRVLSVPTSPYFLLFSL